MSQIYSSLGTSKYLRAKDVRTKLLLTRQTSHEGETQSLPRCDIDFRVIVVSPWYWKWVAFWVNGAWRVAGTAVWD